MREALNAISCNKLVCNLKASAYGFLCLFSSSLSLANQLVIKQTNVYVLKHTCVLNALKTFLNSKNNLLPPLKMGGRIRPLNPSFLSIKKRSLQVESDIKCYPEATKSRGTCCARHPCLYTKGFSFQCFLNPERQWVSLSREHLVRSVCLQSLLQQKSLIQCRGF